MESNKSKTTKRKLGLVSTRELLAVNTKLLRAIRGLTQEGLAEKAGKDRSVIIRIEGQRQNLTLDSVDDLARALGVEVEELFRKRDTLGR